MGGAVGGIVKDIFETLSEGSVGQWLKPAMRELEGTGAGMQAANILRNGFEPEVARTASFYRNSLRYTSEAANRAAIDDMSDKYFGKRREGLVNLLQAVDRQSGSKIHVNNVADIIDVYLGERGIEHKNWRLQAQQAGLRISESSSYKPPGDVERLAKEVASWIFLPRIAIPHATQPLNVLLYEGASAFGKATSEMFAGGLDAAKRRIINSGALEEQILSQIRDTAKGGGIARTLFHMPGFNYLREMQITHSALAGEFAVRDAFDEYIANGRRMTPNLKLVFDRHGIDVAQLGNLQQLTPGMIQTAQYRAAQSTYFMRSALDTPYPWSQNWMTRMATMYKQFGYNQGRFVISAIHDSFKASPEEGIKTIALLSTLFPMAGFAVKTVEDGMSLRPAPTTQKEKDEYFSQYVDAVGHAAGFGIGYSIFRSAKRHSLANFIIGPIPSTISDYTQDIINADTPAGRRTLGKDVLRRIPLAGPGLSQTLLPRKKAGRKSRVTDAY